MAGLKLHLGCGPRIQSGWVNADFHARDRSVVQLDLRDPLPFADGVVTHIHCEHVLEHIEFAEALSLLRECARVLESEGTFRVIVPDAGRYMRAYASKDEAFFASVKNIGNPSTPFATHAEIVNQAFRMGGSHKFGWDESTLRYYLEREGFEVRISSIHDVQKEYDIDGTDEWRIAESLYVNAKRSQR